MNESLFRRAVHGICERLQHATGAGEWVAVWNSDNQDVVVLASGETQADAEAKAHKYIHAGEGAADAE